MAASDRVPVTGSERVLTPGHTRVGEVDLGADVDVTVYVRPRAPLAWVDAESARAPQGRRLVAREDWADAHGAADDDMTAVAHYALDAGLTVISVDSARRAGAICAGRCGRPPTPSGPRWRAGSKPPTGRASTAPGRAR